MTVSDAGNAQVLDSDGPGGSRWRRFPAFMRIWMVMSVIWLIGGSPYFSYEYNKTEVERAFKTCAAMVSVPADATPSTTDPNGSNAVDEIKTLRPELSSVVKDAKDLKDCDKVYTVPTTWSIETLMAVLITSLLGILLFPLLIVVFWLLVYGPIRWIAGNQQIPDSDEPSRRRPRRLSGGMRLWIVTSAAWLIGGSLFSWYLINKRMNEHVQAAFETCFAMVTVRPLTGAIPNTPKPSTDPLGALAKVPADLALSLLPRELSSVVKDAKDLKDCDKVFTVPRTWFTDTLIGILILLLLAIPLFPLLILLFWVLVGGPVRWIARGFQT